MLTAQMDHGHIDEHSLAERYVSNTLSPEDRAAFEAHLVDCTDCTDRVLLAEMFHARKTEALRVRLAAHLKPWQLVLIFAVTVLLLVAVPALLIPLLIH